MLLVEIGDEKDRGEKKFRFSINYAYLFSKDKRLEAFKTAKKLYDIRSHIAHGGEPKDIERINGKDMNIIETMILARSALRNVISIFLNNPSKPDFTEPDYWAKKTLNLED